MPRARVSRRVGGASARVTPYRSPTLCLVPNAATAGALRLARKLQSQGTPALRQGTPALRRGTPALRQ
eukprot:8868419-Pyramimonas_sp.AAC.1